MDLTQLANLGEFIGGVAVLVTLVYLATQVRQGTKAVLISNHEVMIAAVRSMRHAIAQDSELAELVLRGEAASSDLSPIDERRFEEFVVSQFEVWEQAFLARELGTIDRAVWAGWDNFGREKFNTKGHHAVWRKTRLEFWEPFREYVDRAVFAETGAAS